MTTNINFQPSNQHTTPTTLGKEIGQGGFSYFNFGRLVAALKPGAVLNRMTGVELQAEQTFGVETSAKIVAYFSKNLPSFAWAFIQGATLGGLAVATVGGILHVSAQRNKAKWIQKATTNDCDVTKEEFLRLSIDLKNEIFQTANIHISKAFLLKLRDFGMRPMPAQPERAALFSYNMDAVEIEERLQRFLEGLRTVGLLLTEEEFAQKDLAQYYHKYDDIGRILGRDYIERTAHRLHLPYIKVPKKTAVIRFEDMNASSLEFTVSRNGHMALKCEGLQVYAERITPIERRATQEEMLGLLDLVEEIKFNDFVGDNLFMGKNQSDEEGIYFIDTEYKNFGYLPSYTLIGQLGALMEPKDLPWLEQELTRRFHLFQQQKPAMQKVVEQQWGFEEPLLIQYGFRDRSKPFTISIASLVSQKVRTEM